MNPPVSVAAQLPEVAKSFLGVDIKKLPSSISRTSSFLHSTPYSTSSQRMLTKSRNLLQGRIFQGGKNLTWHRSMLLNVLERWDNPQNYPFPLGISAPSNTRFRGSTSQPPPIRHLDRISRFCRAHGHDQHTDRPTTLLPSVAIGHHR